MAHMSLPWMLALGATAPVLGQPEWAFWPDAETAYEQWRLGTSALYAPSNLADALAPLYAGADGETKAAIEAYLWLGSDREENLALFEDYLMTPPPLPGTSRYLAMWGQYDYYTTTDYQQIIGQQFLLPFEGVDFVGDRYQAQDYISDSWFAAVGEHFSSSVTDNTRLLITGSWQMHLDWHPEMVPTWEGFVQDGSWIYSDYAYRAYGAVDELPYGFAPEATMIRMPLGEYGLSLFLVRPTGKAEDLRKELTLDRLQGWIQQMHPVLVEWKIPFSASSNESAYLPTELASLAEASADFSYLFPQEGIYVDDVSSWHQFGYDPTQGVTLSLATTVSLYIPDPLLPDFGSFDSIGLVIIGSGDNFYLPPAASPPAIGFVLNKPYFVFLVNEEDQVLVATQITPSATSREGWGGEKRWRSSVWFGYAYKPYTDASGLLISGGTLSFDNGEIISVPESSPLPQRPEDLHYHMRLGWITLPQDVVAEGMWFYHSLEGWLWTSAEVYPNAYSPAAGWVYLD